MVNKDFQYMGNGTR